LNSHLLITGATGLVGSGYLRLRRSLDPQLKITAITRQNLHVDGANRTLVHDLRLPVELPPDVTEIFHAAADVRFTLPLEEARAANVDSTRHLLDAARGLAHLRHFLHVSSVYAAGRTLGVLKPERWTAEAGFVSTYEQTKFESEELVFEAMPRLPATVIRLSSVFGDAGTGAVQQYNHTHQLLRFFPRSFLPVAPGNDDAVIDLICSSWLEQQLRIPFAVGRIYHLCAGRDLSLPIRELMEITLDLLPQRPPRVPRLVSLDEYERYVQELERPAASPADRLAREMLRALNSFLPHLGMPQHFEPSPEVTPHPEPRAFVRRVVEGCLRTNWGRTA